MDDWQATQERNFLSVWTNPIRVCIKSLRGQKCIYVEEGIHISVMSSVQQVIHRQ